jgi:hypothetical protein
MKLLLESMGRSLAFDVFVGWRRQRKLADLVFDEHFPSK